MKLKTIKVIVFFTTLSFAVLACAQADQSGAPVKVKEIEGMIAKELPKGSTKSQVLSFLDSRKIEHSEYLEKNKTIYGILRNTSEGALVKGSIQLEFIFDENGLLLNHTVKEVFTGP